MDTVLAPEARESRPRAEQSRARYPEATGIAERAGGRIAWEVYGRGEPRIMFVPPWQIVHARIWKAQIPYFARHHRVIAWDARGNGRSDRPLEPEAHTDHAQADDLVAVLDATGTDAAVLVSLSGAANPAIVAASDHPQRVLGLVFIAPSVALGQPRPERQVPFEERLASDEGWSKQNIHFWRRDFPGFLEFFFGKAFPEPHSTKPIEDGVGYGLDTDAETLAATMRAPFVDRAELLDRCARIRHPTLIIQGDDDLISHVSRGVELAHAIQDAQLEILQGAGHIPNVRDPVRVNLLIRDFIRSVPGEQDHAGA
jgi:pimeloyl-ACP methyl ester carboxylesterase